MTHPVRRKLRPAILPAVLVLIISLTAGAQAQPIVAASQPATPHEAQELSQQPDGGAIEASADSNRGDRVIEATVFVTARGERETGPRSSFRADRGPKFFVPFPARDGAAVSAQNKNGAQTGGVYTPLTAEEKLKFGLRNAFLNPFSYALTGVNAAITQATEEDQPHKTSGDRFADGLSRFAISTGTRSIKSLLGSGVYPALFKQDPRYRRAERKGFGPRFRHAVSRVFVTDGDNGSQQLNYSRLGGTITASALANLYERSTPGRDRIGVGPTFKRFGTSVGIDVLQFVLIREFGPDIKEKIFGK
ncbi:MAG: hypothetical protein ACRD9R_09015 [Pyrinomonadaceae bacterium]